jgi:hypothetical protein
MSDVTLEVTVASDGTVESVSGGDAIRNGIDNEAMAPTDRDLRRTVASTALLPAAPSSIQPGGAWSYAFTESHPVGAMHYDAEYELAGLETIASIPVSTVTITADMELEAQQPQGSGGPDVETRLLDSHYRSQVIFDLQRREAVGRYTRETQVVEQTMTMRGRTLSQRMTQQVESDLIRTSESWE